jgi:hypothetical protein
MYQAALFELDEVTADAGGRGVDRGGEVFNTARPLLQEKVKDLIGTIVRLCSHLSNSFL